MTVPINFGSQWLNKHRVKTIFEENGNKIELYDRCVRLVAKLNICVKNIVHTVLDKVNKSAGPKP